MAAIPVTLENGGAALKTANDLLEAINKHAANACDDSQNISYQQHEATTVAKLAEALDAVTRYIATLTAAHAPQR